MGLVDLLAEGIQTVLPPSIHPDTNEPYYWWGDFTLRDTPLSELPELPDDIADRLAAVLKPFGYDPEAERPALVRADSPARNAGGARASSIYRRLAKRRALNDQDRKRRGSRVIESGLILIARFQPRTRDVGDPIDHAAPIERAPSSSEG